MFRRSIAIFDKLFVPILISLLRRTTAIPKFAGLFGILLTSAIFCLRMVSDNPITTIEPKAFRMSTNFPLHV